MMLLCSAVVAGSKREKKITPKWSGKHRAELSLPCLPPIMTCPWDRRLDTDTKGISPAVILSPGVTGAMPLALWRRKRRRKSNKHGAHTDYHVPPERDPETRPRVGLALLMDSVTFRPVGAMV